MIQKKEKLAFFGGKPILKKPFPQAESLGSEEERAVARVMKSRVLSGFVGRAGEKFLGGPEVRRFEKLVEKALKVKYAVSYNSATTALQGAIAALGIGPGDEVITTPYTMAATAMSILLNGAVPVFADIEDDTFCLDPVSVEERITKRTKAILVVNLFGGSARLLELKRVAKKSKLYLIEDNAQSIGAKLGKKFLGTIGDVGILSFNANKILQSGEGGVVITDSKKIAFRAQLSRNHGEVVIDDVRDSVSFEAIVGSNYRMTELHAAIAYEQMRKLSRLIRPRVLLGQYLTKQLKRFSWIIPVYIPKSSTHTYYVYPFRFLKKKIGFSRETLIKALTAEGFPLGAGYVKPLYLLPIFQKRRMYPNSTFPFVFEGRKAPVYKKGICPVAERMFKEELLFITICNHERSKRDIDLFVRAIKKITNNITVLKHYERSH